MQPIKQDRQPSGNIDNFTHLFNTANTTWTPTKANDTFKCDVELQVCFRASLNWIGTSNHCTPNSNTINSSNMKLTMNSYKAKEH
jgi:hypothetical protein